MKKQLFLFLTFLMVGLFISCKDNGPTTNGSSVLDEISELTSDSFTMNADFTLSCEEEDATCGVGFFIGYESGVDADNYKYVSDIEEMTTSSKRFCYKFINIDNNNERIIPVGTKVYYRPFISITTSDKISYIYGDESSFEIPKAKYTIMVYGVGGGNLDESNTKNLMIPMMKEGRNGNIELTFQYKKSSIFQSNEYISETTVPQLEGTHRWVSPYSGEFSKIWDDSYDLLLGDEYLKKAYGAIEKCSTRIGERNYAMNDPEHLTSFINWSMEKCPAENYILLLKDHGAGWDLNTDHLDHTPTKAQLFDDNLGLGNSKAMSLIDLMNGIKASNISKFKAIIFDECLMANIENLAEVSQVSEYAVAAMETTISLPGKSLMDIFNKGISDDKETFSILSELVDVYCDTASDKVPKSYTDQGVYNLNKIEPLTDCMSNISSFFNRMYKESGDWKVAINDGVTKALKTIQLSDNQPKTRQKIAELKSKLNMWYTLSEEEKEELAEEIDKLNYSTPFAFSFYDLIVQTIAAAEDYKQYATRETFADEISTLKDLLKNYDSTIREVSYINCTKKISPNIPYELTSPTICLQSLNENVYEAKKGNLYGYYSSNYITREDAIKTYQSLYFDKKTLWSEFLQQVTVSGTLFFSDDRRLRQTGE